MSSYYYFIKQYDLIPTCTKCAVDFQVHFVTLTEFPCKIMHFALRIWVETLKPLLNSDTVYKC